jgi:hypothetical protein
MVDGGGRIRKRAAGEEGGSVAKSDRAWCLSRKVLVGFFGRRAGLVVSAARLQPLRLAVLRDSIPGLSEAKVMNMTIESQKVPSTDDHLLSILCNESSELLHSLDIQWLNLSRQV